MTRVLVVDDHAANLYLLRALFEREGFEVDEARHGAEALSTARRQPPDLIVSDLLMPVLDGYALLRHWRADPQLARIPFVVYTATFTDPRDMRLAMALGADAFLVKPAEPQAILAGARRTLEQAAAGTLPSAAPHLDDARDLLQTYNEVLVHKLEHKVIEGDRITRELRAEIDERHAVERRLHASEERFRSTFEQAAVGIAHVATDGRFAWVNSKLCEMTGYSAEELQLLTFTDLTVPEDRATGVEARERLLRGEKQSYDLEKRYRRKDGTDFWIHIFTTLIHGEDDDPYFVTVVVDISDRKAAETAVKLRDRAIQSVAHGILITDPRQPDNPVIYANDGFQQITGYAPDEMVGRNCRLLQGKDTAPDAVATLRQAVQDGRGCTIEILNYRKDGSPFWNSLSLNPVHDESGLLSHFVGVQKDVTDRRRLEDQLRQAQKMEAVGRLAGGVAHDFNNLLTVILGCSDSLLTESALGDADRELVQAISDAGGRGAALTRQLLGFSRRSVVQPRVLDINVCISQAEHMLRRILGEDILISTALAARLGTVKVDPAQLDQVLMNLAVNARDAMPGGGQLTIETANVQLDETSGGIQPNGKAGAHVMLAVTDTGCGMTREVMDHVFEPFFTTKSADQGTGLGLSVVFGIVHQAGGAVHVYSEPDQGTTFKVYLPVAEPQAEIVVTKKPARAAEPGSETILVVEDEPALQLLAARILTKRGYTVLTANDGRDALRVVEGRDTPLDLVLTDVIMPHVSGPEMVQLLRQRSPRLKVLFMSGYTGDAVVRHGLLESDVNFIAKPYTPDALARKVREVLEQ